MRRDHFVFVTNIRYSHGNVIAAIKLEKSRDGILINDISSIDPKRDGRIDQSISDGLLRGYERQWP